MCFKDDEQGNPAVFVTGDKVGIADITASIASVSGSSRISVSESVLSGLEATVVSSSIPVGHSTDLKVYGIFSDGTKLDITRYLPEDCYSSSDVRIATVANHTVKGLAVGRATIRVAFGKICAQTDINVSAAVLESLTLQAKSSSIPAGLTTALTAWGNFSDGSTRDITAELSESAWSSSNPKVATVSKGQVSALTPGTAVIAATADEVSGKITISVTKAILSKIEVFASENSFPICYTSKLTVYGVYSDGSSTDITTELSEADWSSSDTKVATVAMGVVTGKARGKVSITASFGGYRDVLSLTVTEAILQTLSLTAEPASIPSGYTAHVRAEGLYSDGSRYDLTEHVPETAWSSSDSQVASVNRGIVTSKAPGKSSIYVNVKDGTREVQASTTVSVTEAVLSGLTLTSSTDTINVGNKTKLTATALFSDGSTCEVTDLLPDFAWTSSQPAVATVAKGEVTGVSPGQVAITASCGDYTATVNLSVVEVQLVSLELKIKTTELYYDESQPLQVIATYSDGRQAEVTQSVRGQDWSSSDLSVAIITDCHVKALNKGNATLSAVYKGKRASIDITVVKTRVLGLTICMRGAICRMDQPTQLQATALLSDRTVVDVTKRVEWSCDCLRIDEQGRAWGLYDTKHQHQQLHASLGDQRDSCLVTVAASDENKVSFDLSYFSGRVSAVQTVIIDGYYLDNEHIESSLDSDIITPCYDFPKSCHDYTLVIDVVEGKSVKQYCARMKATVGDDDQTIVIPGESWRPNDLAVLTCRLWRREFITKDDFVFIVDSKPVNKQFVSYKDNEITLRYLEPGRHSVYIRHLSSTEGLFDYDFTTLDISGSYIAAKFRLLEPQPVEEYYRLEPETPVLDTGERLAMHVFQKRGQGPDEEEVTSSFSWESMNSEVFTVDNQGVITAKSPGKARLRGIDHRTGKYMNYYVTVQVNGGAL